MSTTFVREPQSWQSRSKQQGSPGPQAARRARWHGVLASAGSCLWAALLLACSEGAQPTQSPHPLLDMGLSGPYQVGERAPQALTEVAAVPVGERIYLLGGLSAGGGTHRVEIYDPIHSTWSRGPDLPADAPTHHLAVAVWQQQIYVLGGYVDLSFAPSALTLRLDPARGTWIRLRDQPLARGAATAQTLGLRIYVVGGAGLGQVLSALWSYDPAADTWQIQAAMPLAREHLASCADGVRMLVVGGRASANLNTAQIYEADRDRWTMAPDLPTARGGLAAATLDRRCYVVGGEALDRGPPNTFGENEAYDWDRALWTSQARLPTPRHGLAAVAIGPSLYTLLGGPQAGFTFSDVVEIFSP